MPAEPRSICIVKLGAIGDVVNSLPFVCRLRAGFPAARITWAIAPLAHQLVSGHDAVDEFLVIDVKCRSTLLGKARELRRARFDLVIDLQRILKSGLITRVTGAPRRLGFDRARCKELSWLLTNDRIPPRSDPGVTVEQYLEFADHLGLPQCEPEWRLPRDDWAGDAPRVCLNIGASKPANQWPVAHWAELAQGLAQDIPASRIALTGGPQDRALADEILRDGPHGMLDTVGMLSLRESAGLIAASSVFVGGDTGPMHMAVAVGTPLVALFGAADPERTGPFRSPQSVIYEPAECSPCRQRSCTVAGHPCMTGIGPQRVLEAVRSRARA
ncbi:MAG: lipopolysaccharide heptosyltransferase II [Chlamydiales bacterium]|jgi:lipopolysaccharide heptosyltransferase II